MNHKKDLRKGKTNKDDQLNFNSEKYESPIPIRRFHEDNFDRFNLHDLSPFPQVYKTINTAPNPIFLTNSDLAIIETPNVKTEPRPYLDQMDDSFQQISQIIAWDRAINDSVSEDNQNIQSQFHEGYSSFSEQQEKSLQQMSKPIQIKPLIKKQDVQQIKIQQNQKKQIFKKQLKQVQEKFQKKIICNCKKTKCLKLYCDCFRENLVCGQDCNCFGCHNLQAYEDERNNAMLTLMDRNPQAFAPKIDVQKHSKGCHCKKSNCLKKYCECYQAGIKCGSNCKCQDCKNDQCCSQEIESKQKQNKITAKKQKHFAQIINQD